MPRALETEATASGVLDLCLARLSRQPTCQLTKSIGIALLIYLENILC
jgi:hypothetical protein